jgi:hypothetical protein
MQLRTNIRGRPTAGAAIAALTFAYALVMAAIAFYTFDASWKVAGLLFDESFFWGPMLIAYGLSRWRVSDTARRVLLGFQVGYSILTFIIFWTTFTGENDAQYQLALLFIPLFGFPSVVIAGLIAARLR